MADEYMPAVRFHGEAYETWWQLWDQYAGWNVEIVTTAGAVKPSRIVGSGTAESDGFVGLRAVPVDTDEWEPVPGAPEEFYRCDELQEVRVL